MKHTIAAFIFFTRLPFWQHKMFHLDKKYFENVINYWAVAGWLTASVMAATLWLSAKILPLSIAVILAIIARILLTGALHEDGLADFFDGMGGGYTKAQILRIMKDSFIGVYAVIGLVLYFLILYHTLLAFGLSTAVLVILSADPLSKFVVAQKTLFLPYARTEEGSKCGVIYQNMKPIPFIISALFGLLPTLCLLPPKMWIATLATVLSFLFLILFLKKKIGGYTGDTCGALFLICELITLLSFLYIHLHF